MPRYTIYHNPRCSKSRQTLELLQNHGADIVIVEYLKNPPTSEQISTILKALKMSPQQIMRTKEADYSAAGLDNPNLSEAEQIDLLAQYPKAIERPIVVKGKKAVIGRPPENVNQLF